MTPVLTLGPLSVTPYSLIIFAGVIAGVLLTWHKKEIRPLLPAVIFGAVVIGHLMWVFFCPYDFEAAEGKLYMILHPWEGGYTLYGALLGGAFGALIAGKVAGIRWTDALDALAPGACAVIILGRIGEMFTGEGIGREAAVEWTHFFPLSVCTYQDDFFDEWRYAVWFWEALAALILLIVLLKKQKKALPGHQTALFVTVLGTSQIFLEQMRRDHYLRLIVFVRVTQLAALITLIVLLVILFVRRKPGAAKIAWTSAAFTFAGLAVMCVEFVFDKPEHLPWLNAAMALTAVSFAGMYWTLRQRKGILPAALFCAAAAALLIFYNATNWNDFDPEPVDDMIRFALLYGMMALDLLCIGLTVRLHLKEETSH